MTKDTGINLKKQTVRFWIIASSLISLLMSAGAAQADRRIAFVVGNGAYKNVAQLSSPRLDAIAMATTLRNVGFEVVEGTDLTTSKMREKFDDFGWRAQCSDVAVFFYAGLSITLNGQNYLLPVDADFKSEMDVKLGAAIDLNSTLNRITAKIKVVLLEASREHTFATRIKFTSTRVVTVQTGLAEMKTDEGMLIAFSTGPGQVLLDGTEATISPFTRALISHITKPDVEIQQAMMKVRTQVGETNKGQLPWEQANLKGPVYLNPVRASPDSAAAASRSTNIELRFWQLIKDSCDLEKFKAYLKAYPNGQFRSLALARIASMEHGLVWQAIPDRLSEPAAFSDKAGQMDEDMIGLYRDQRRCVQRRLTALGFDIMTSGNFNDDTRSVIKRWQATRGYPVSGYLNAEQHEALSAEIDATTEDPPPRHVRRRE